MSAEPLTVEQIEALAAQVLLVSLAQRGGTQRDIERAITATVNVVVAWAETRDRGRKQAKRAGKAGAV